MAILNYNINTQDEYEPWIYYEEWKAVEIPQGVFPEISQVPRYWPRYELGPFINEYNNNLFYVWDWRDYNSTPYLLHCYLQITTYYQDGSQITEVVKSEWKCYGHSLIAERVHPSSAINPSRKEVEGNIFEATSMEYLDSCGQIRTIGSYYNFNLYRWFDPDFLWIEENIDPNYPEPDCILNFRYRIYIPNILEEYSDLEITWWVDGNDSPPPATLNCGDCEINCDSVYGHLVEIKNSLRNIK